MKRGATFTVNFGRLALSSARRRDTGITRNDSNHEALATRNLVKGSADSAHHAARQQVDVLCGQPASQRCGLIRIALSAGAHDSDDGKAFHGVPLGVILRFSHINQPAIPERALAVLTISILADSRLLHYG